MVSRPAQATSGQVRPSVPWPLSGGIVLRTVITGGAGFIGSHLCERFLSDGDEVICVDNLLTGNPRNIAHLVDNPSFRFLEHNISEPVEIDGPVDNVLHFASPASPVDYLTHPYRPSRWVRSAPITRSGSRRPRTRGFCWPARPRSTAIPRSTPSAKTTGATSTRSARGAATTRPSGSPRRSRWPTIAITASRRGSCASSTPTVPECGSMTGVSFPIS